jgi:hypothetical protein
MKNKSSANSFSSFGKNKFVKKEEQDNQTQQEKKEETPTNQEVIEVNAVEVTHVPEINHVVMDTPATNEKQVIEAESRSVDPIEYMGNQDELVQEIHVEIPTVNPVIQEQIVTSVIASTEEIKQP